MVNFQVRLQNQRETVMHQSSPGVDPEEEEVEVTVEIVDAVEHQAMRGRDLPEEELEPSMELSNAKELNLSRSSTTRTETQSNQLRVISKKGPIIVVEVYHVVEATTEVIVAEELVAPTEVAEEATKMLEKTNLRILMTQCLTTPSQNRSMKLSSILSMKKSRNSSKIASSRVLSA